MYAGHIVEPAGVKGTFRQPRHPYTRACWSRRRTSTARSGS